MGLVKGPLTSPPRGSRLIEFATNFETCQIVLPLLDFLYSFDPTWCSLENCSIVWDNDEALRSTRDESFKLPLELVCFLRLFSGRSHVGGVPYGLVENTFKHSASLDRLLDFCSQPRNPPALRYTFCGTRNALSNYVHGQLACQQKVPLEGTLACTSCFSLHTWWCLSVNLLLTSTLEIANSLGLHSGLASPISFVPQLFHRLPMDLSSSSACFSSSYWLPSTSRLSSSWFSRKRPSPKMHPIIWLSLLYVRVLL